MSGAQEGGGGHGLGSGGGWEDVGAPGRDFGAIPVGFGAFFGAGAAVVAARCRCRPLSSRCPQDEEAAPPPALAMEPGPALTAPGRPAAAAAAARAL